MHLVFSEHKFTSPKPFFLCLKIARQLGTFFRHLNLCNCCGVANYIGRNHDDISVRYGNESQTLNIQIMEIPSQTLYTGTNPKHLHDDKFFPNFMGIIAQTLIWECFPLWLTPLWKIIKNGQKGWYSYNNWEKFFP